MECLEQNLERSTRAGEHSHKPNLEHSTNKAIDRNMNQLCPDAVLPFAVPDSGWGFTHQAVPPLEVQSCDTSRWVQGEISLGPALDTQQSWFETLSNSTSQAMCKFSSVKFELNEIQALWKSIGFDFGGCGMRLVLLPHWDWGKRALSDPIYIAKIICHTLTMKIYKELYSFLSSLNPGCIFPQLKCGKHLTGSAKSQSGNTLQVHPWSPGTTAQKLPKHNVWKKSQVKN